MGMGFDNANAGSRDSAAARAAAAAARASAAAAALAAARAAAETDSKRTGKRLRIILKNSRKVLGLSLREAAKKSGVSNPYISQIEAGMIPAPRILYQLAKGYGLNFEELMVVAGHLKPKAGDIPDAENIILSAAKDLTEQEKREVISFIKYLVFKRKIKGAGDGLKDYSGRLLEP